MSDEYPLAEILRRDDEIAALKTQLDDLETRLEAWREFGKAAKTWQFRPYLTITKKLKSLNEI